VPTVDLIDFLDYTFKDGQCILRTIPATPELPATTRGVIEFIFCHSISIEAVYPDKDNRVSDCERWCGLFATIEGHHFNLSDPIASKGTERPNPASAWVPTAT
jgi:hypothetical protein